jgi:DNA topoisomerase-1
MRSTRFMDGLFSMAARKRLGLSYFTYKVGNYRIEPPGLFRGRGQHPLTGTLKTRVLPEQVTLNIGENAMIPDPPAGHKWGLVQHDNSVTWLATWKDNVNGVRAHFLNAYE